MPFSCLSCQFGNFTLQQRYIGVIIMQFSLLCAYQMRMVLNVAITEIIPPKVSNSTSDACPDLVSPPVVQKGKMYDWPPETEALILYTFYIGYVLGHMPAGWLADKIGGRHVLGCSVMLSTIMNTIMPYIITNVGATGTVVVRTLTGFAQGPVYPAISSLIQNWVPKKERGLLGSVAYGGANLGTLTGCALTGYLIEYTQNWAIPFYMCSVCAIVWYVFFLLYVFSKPENHPFITEKELEYISSEIAADHKKFFKVPYMKICLSPCVWALLFGQWGHNYIFFTMFTTLPRYMKDILKLNVSKNSYFSTLPFLMLWISTMVSGWFGDLIIKKEWLSILTTRKLYTAVGAFVPSVCILLAVVAGCNRVLAIVFYTIGVAFIGPFYSGMKVNVNDITRYYGGCIMSLINGLGAIFAILCTVSVGQIVKKASLTQWMMVYLLNMGVQIVCTLFYLIFAKAERQDWDYPEMI